MHAPSLMPLNRGAGLQGAILPTSGVDGFARLPSATLKN